MDTSELKAKAGVPPSCGEADRLKPELQPNPADSAFLALAHHQLGHGDEAKKLLDQLRQLLQQDRWKNDAEFQAEVDPKNWTGVLDRILGALPPRPPGF